MPRRNSDSGKPVETNVHRKDKEAKVSTSRTLWVPAVNNHAAFGRWEFLEIEDPWNAKNTIRVFLSK